MTQFYTTKSTLKERREAVQKREKERIAQRRAELEGTSIDAIRDAEVRPLSEAKRALDENFKNLVRELRANLLSVPDEDFVQDFTLVNPNDAGLVKANNQIAYEQFKIFHPEGSECPWCRSEKNLDAMERYFAVNSAVVMTPDMLSRAWCKLSVNGLTEQKPEPESRTPITFEPARPEWFNIEDYNWDDPAGKPSDKIAGFDWRKTGERRTLTRYEIEQLSSDDYLKFTNFGRQSSARLRNV